MFFSLFLLIYFSGYSLYRILSLSHITFGFCNLIPIIHSLKSNSLNANRSQQSKGNEISESDTSEKTQKRG